MHTTWISKQRPEPGSQHTHTHTHTHTADVRLHLSAPLTSFLHYVLHSKPFEISSPQSIGHQAWDYPRIYASHCAHVACSSTHTHTHIHTQMPRRLSDWAQAQIKEDSFTPSRQHLKPSAVSECQVRYSYKMWSWGWTHMQGTVLSV